MKPYVPSKESYSLSSLHTYIIYTYIYVYIHIYLNRYEEYIFIHMKPYLPSKESYFSPRTS